MSAALDTTARYVSPSISERFSTFPEDYYEQRPRKWRTRVQDISTLHNGTRKMSHYSAFYLKSRPESRDPRSSHNPKDEARSHDQTSTDDREQNKLKAALLARRIRSSLLVPLPKNGIREDPFLALPIPAEGCVPLTLDYCTYRRDGEMPRFDDTGHLTSRSEQSFINGPQHTMQITHSPAMVAHILPWFSLSRWTTPSFWKVWSPCVESSGSPHMRRHGQPIRNISSTAAAHWRWFGPNSTRRNLQTMRLCWLLSVCRASKYPSPTPFLSFSSSD